MASSKGQKASPSFPQLISPHHEKTFSLDGFLAAINRFSTSYVSYDRMIQDKSEMLRSECRQKQIDAVCIDVEDMYLLLRGKVLLDLVKLY